MTYLTSLLLIGVAMIFFLILAAKLQRGVWPSDEARSLNHAVRELLIGRRLS